MNEEPTSPMTTPSGLFLHYCEHEGCSAWGGHGYARSKNAPVQWFCYDHRETGERILGRL